MHAEPDALIHATDLGGTHAASATPSTSATPTPTSKYNSLPSSPTYRLTIITTTLARKREGIDNFQVLLFILLIFFVFFLPILPFPPLPHFGPSPPLLPRPSSSCIVTRSRNAQLGWKKNSRSLFFLPFPRVIPVPFFRRHFSNPSK